MVRLLFYDTNIGRRTHPAENTGHLQHEVELRTPRNLAGTLGRLQGLELELRE